MSLYEEKHALYRKYVEELDKFRKKPLRLSEKECRQICDDYIQSKNSSWHNIYDPASGELVGFVIIGKNYPEKHRDSLRSVSQAYVLPQYRKRAESDPFPGGSPPSYGLLVSAANPEGKEDLSQNRLPGPVQC